MAKELTDILKAAAVVRDETAAEQNTASRVGTVLADLANFVGEALFAAGLSVKSNSTGVSLLIKYHNAEGQAYINELPLPLLNNEQAGVATPQLINNFQTKINSLNERYGITLDSLEILKNSKLPVQIELETHDSSVADGKVTTTNVYKIIKLKAADGTLIAYDVIRANDNLNLFAGWFSALDRKNLSFVMNKLENYPSQLMKDLGLVSSQDIGEKFAARSEIAGNRQISFIRFEVNGVSARKTTLIMQWPNGINETAQLKFVDKAQWRRNVSGATGVEGNTTTATQWERTAPHYIGYDPLRRMIQLKDYTQTVSREVELPLATSSQHGLMNSSDKAKMDNYPSTPQEIPTATMIAPGLLSAADKKNLTKEVAWTSRSHMNTYTECGEFHIKGERTNEKDGLPILNADPGHTIDATLTVLDSSLTNGTGAQTDTCVTQILRMSNRIGGDGHIFIRTGQATTKSQLASAYSTYWGPWEKLMGIYEKNAVTSVAELDTCTTNGMYSGIFASTNGTALGGIKFYPGDTFLMITANGYAATPFGTPQLTQILFKFPVRNANIPPTANMYLRVAYWDADNQKWIFENFTRMATNDELSSQVATLTAKIKANAANIAGATTTASEALTTAQEAQAAATSASENAAQAQELATEAKTVAEQAQGTAANALSEAIEAKSNAATAFGAASNALGIADAAQNKNAEQDERLVRIENAIESFHAPSDYVEMTITNEQTQRNVLFWKIEWIDDLTIDGQLINTDGLEGKFFRTLSAGEHQVRFRVSEENRTQRGLLGWADDESAGYLSHVTRIVIPEGWTELPANCFERRKHLEEIVMPSTLEIVGGNCFQSLPALRELIIPKNVITINWSAINDCASLKYIRMGGNESMPLSLSFEAIRNCPALTCIEFLPCQLTFKGNTSPFQNLPQLNALICHLTAAPTFEPASPFGNIGSSASNKTLYRPAGIAFYSSGYWSTQLCTTLGFTPTDI